MPCTHETICLQFELASDTFFITFDTYNDDDDDEEEEEEEEDNDDEEEDEDED